MNMHSNRSSETDFKLWITGTHLSWDLGPLRPTECIWTIRYTIRGWFTAGPIRTMTAGMTRNGRRGQERCAAGQRRQWVGHQPWMKTVCRVGIFSHVGLLCDLGFIPTKTEMTMERQSKTVSVSFIYFMLNLNEVWSTVACFCLVRKGSV